MKNKRRWLWLALTVLLIGVTAFSGLLSEESHRVTTTSVPAKNNAVLGVWINYLEFAAMIHNCDVAAYTANATRALDAIQNTGLNTVFLHLRSHSDSLYPSQLFPWSVHINGGRGVSYDPLQIFVDLAQERNIRVHGWVNPYRISSGKIEDLPIEHPANELKGIAGAVVQTEDGVYYNPAVPEVRSLVLAGVRELLEAYPLDGIQYDDYFYPTTQKEFDELNYQLYCQKTASPLSLADWRRCQVDLLISGTYQLTRQYLNVQFSVSPAADIDKNRDSLYADVSAWVAGGYVDFLCPQLYFGFDYPEPAFRFDRLLSAWQQAAGELPLVIGLGAYKVGQEDAGSTEWVTATDLPGRQAAFLKNQASVMGVAVYSYTALYGESSLCGPTERALQDVLAGFSTR